MLFHTWQFAVFFTVVYILYLLLPQRWQNRLLLLASCIFYGSWNWRFLFLVLFSTVINFLLGAKIYNAKSPQEKRRFLYLSLFINLGILAFFKYLNFFIANAQALLNTLGIPTEPLVLKIILPLGISFYTFQALSYIFDIYRGQIPPAPRILDFALYKLFFPQLIAGPIERATRLLPQVLLPRKVTLKHLGEGLHLFFLGLLLKVFIADNLAKIVDPIFTQGSNTQGAMVLIGAYAFTFQIYCDFAGYSNMARGLALMMGFDLMVNFKWPFFVTNVQEFWNQWHISLSSWIRDYLYFPLFNSLKNIKGNFRIYIALFISMTVIGLWHGASWNFVLFGLYYGVLLILYLIWRTSLAKYFYFSHPLIKTIATFLSVVFMFHLTTLGMLLFRAGSLSQIGGMLQALGGKFQLSWTAFFLFTKFLSLIFPLLLLHLGEYLSADPLFFYRRHWAFKTVGYAFMTYLILGWGVFNGVEFIYFQF